ncbi:anti-sigma factor family protein [Pelotomaculum propionicicum]|uniref:anti-sigma factor family protein n=1 Tax=Pelotomaculum propionicicum TaxID=258475 RepID=UPI003B7A0379
MNCKAVRANLANYLAKEYYLFNQAQFEEHLAVCPSCRADLFALAELDLMLSRLPGETAPPDFAAAVTGRIKKTAPVTKTQLKERAPSKLIFYRDLAAAAAATLVIFFSGGNFFDYQNFNLAAQKMNAAVQVCLKTSGVVINQAYDTAGNISPQLILKELNQNEVRPSQ